MVLIFSSNTLCSLMLHVVFLQEKKLLDLPKLLDLCAIYGHENDDLTRLLVSIFSHKNWSITKLVVLLVSFLSMCFCFSG